MTGAMVSGGDRWIGRINDSHRDRTPHPSLLDPLLRDAQRLDLKSGSSRRRADHSPQTSLSGTAGLEQEQSLTNPN